MADEAWCARFHDFCVINGDPRHSDHRPIIVVIRDDVAAGRKLGGHTFRFEAGWVQEEQCTSIVDNAWKLTMNARVGSVVDAVCEVGAELWDWSRNILGDLEKRIKRAKKNLEECRRMTINGRNIAREEILRYKLEKLEAQKELYWR